MNISTLKFVVPEMHCAGCMGKLEKGISKLSSVKSVRANLSLKQLTVTWEGSNQSGASLSKAIRLLGFENHTLEDNQLTKGDTHENSNGLLFCLAVAGFATANIMLLSVSIWSGAEAETEKLFAFISGVIAVPAVAIAGWPFFRSAIRALELRQLNMDVPISLAVLLSVGMSIYEALWGGGETFFDASVMLLFFLLIGRVLDHAMSIRAASGVKSLARMMSGQATRLMPDGDIKTIETSAIVPGMALKLLPGDRLPVDARLVSEEGIVDRSIVTGESEPVNVKKNDILESGTTNGPTSVVVEATTDEKNSFLAHVLTLMEAAETGRGKYRRIADRMAQIYAPAVHLLALVTFIVWFAITGEIKPSLVSAIAVLIITCPCALGLAVPVTHVVAANRLFSKGILMRDGSALERLAEANTVFFDKTGTLSTPRLSMDNVGGQLNEDEKELIGALSVHSSHPISVALRSEFPVSKSLQLDRVKEHAGLGVECIWFNRRVRLGLPQWVHEITADKTIDTEMGCAFGIEGGCLIPFDLESQMRPGSRDVIEWLEAQNLNTFIVSGDGRSQVESFAKRLGVKNALFRCDPTEKLELIKKKQKEGNKILMVGDGLNDAPSLSAAHVSIAPASATDVSRNTADFVFTRPSLIAVSDAMDIAQRARSIVRQNFSIAILYNCIAVPLAMAGFVTPLIAAILMSLSSLVVVGNSMRLFHSRSTGLEGEEGSSESSASAADGVRQPAMLKV